MKSPHTPRYRRLKELIVEARHDAGMTQVELAARLGRPQSYVSKIELGERRIDVVELIDLADELGFDLHLVIDEIKRVGARKAPPRRRSSGRLAGKRR